MLRIGDRAPDFAAETTQGPISLYRWLGDEWWGLLISHPHDFTPVCTTEIGAIARRLAEFSSRRVKVLALSVDSLESHRAWVRDIEETQGARVSFPIASDRACRIAMLYGMVHPRASDTSTVRTVFIIDPARNIRLTMAYPLDIGRSTDELLRVIDALQLADGRKVATPADWKRGDPCLIPTDVVDLQEMKELYSGGWKELKPYLRLTQHPMDGRGE